MGRRARVVIEGIPHHVIQRGSRRQQTFFSNSDYEFYMRVMQQRCCLHGIEIWAYCLMPNHVHLIAVPMRADELSRAIGEAHRYYAVRVNMRQKWEGHLWQERFSSYPMDEKHLLAAARYIERNPVAAGLTDRPEIWRWSSARAHLEGRDDGLVMVAPLLNIVPNWGVILQQQSKHIDTYKIHERTGLPLGDEEFLERCETAVGISLRHKKPGPKGSRKSAPGTPGTMKPNS
jgi:putative transposase